VAAIIAPGGGYRRVVIDKEGPDTSAWLNSLGVTTFVLFYRMPEDGHANAEDVALQDAQRSIRFVRAHAKEWGLSEERIGYVGYSAGGHLGASLAAFHDRKIYRAVDRIDTVSPRPDFVVLGYPGAGLLGGATADNINQLSGRDRVFWKYRIETPITASPPPTFIFHAEDDPAVQPEHSQRIARALRAAGGSTELHVFRTGGHGFGIRDTKGPVSKWPELCEAWLWELGILGE
jgi:acetyl esterase/lipase